MKAIVVLGAMLIGMTGAASLWAAEAVPPDIFQIEVPVVIAAGLADVIDVPVVTTPSNKRLVIQSVSLYTDNAPAGSSTQMFLGTTIFNNLTYWTAKLYNDGSPYPGTTLSSTFYEARERLCCVQAEGPRGLLGQLGRP